MKQNHYQEDRSEEQALWNEQGLAIEERRLSRSALRFVHQNPQCTAVHPNYVKSVIAQCANGRVVGSVDGYRIDSKIIREAGYVKMNCYASGNSIVIFVEKR
jgi:hypothetical protein